MKNIPDNSDLFRALGVPGIATPEAVDRAHCAQQSHNFKMTPVKWLAWKILRDPYYAETYRHYRSIDLLKRAAFFDDRLPYEKLPWHEDRKWFTTPVYKIANMLHKQPRGSHAPPVVLLTTGGFSPIHNAHIAMMERAKKEMERRGRRVVGGYISPSHDDYVLHKNDASRMLPGSHRIRLCEEALAKSDWLMVDAWEARYVSAALLLTDVIAHLERHLNRRFPNEHIEIVYVFGGDNAEFARAFVGKGSCVCIPRPGYEKILEQVKRDPAIATNPHIIFGARTAGMLSSTAIRNGANSDLPAQAKTTFRSWMKQLTPRTEPAPPKIYYALRDESEWATAPWKTKISSSRLSMATENFKRGLILSITKAFTRATAPDRRMPVTIRVLPLAKQTAYVRALARKQPILNLDYCTPGKHRLNISRLFGLGNGQCSANTLIARPGYAPIKKQIAALPSGAYTLVEDDIATGQTIRKVRRLLPKRIKIEDTVALSRVAHDKMKEPLWDIVDFRDFLVGSRGSGLVVALPDGTPVRAPYMLPYVSLATRAKIPPSAELWFSRALWKLNAKFFHAIPALRLRDADPPLQALMSYLEFQPNDTLEYICNWHAAQF